MERISTIN